MLRSPLKSPTVRALGVTLTTFAVLGGASMVVTSGVTAVVRFGLRQHRVGQNVWNAAVTQPCLVSITFLWTHTEETCRSLPYMPQEGHKKLSSLQRYAHSYLEHVSQTH